METEVKLTKLAGCAGCGAKVGAGTLVHLLEGFRTHTDPRLIVGYDKSDDASVYVLDENTALVQTTDFFPPIVDDPFLYGQIAAANALSDVYAMGGEPRTALNIMCLHSPDSAILSAVIFNALIIVFLIPLALKGVSYKPLTASAMLRRNLWIYGLGGLLVPFIGIKVIDLLLTVCGLV